MDELIEKIDEAGISECAGHYFVILDALDRIDIAWLRYLVKRERLDITMGDAANAMTKLAEVLEEVQFQIWLEGNQIPPLKGNEEEK